MKLFEYNPNFSPGKQLKVINTFLIPALGALQKVAGIQDIVMDERKY